MSQIAVTFKMNLNTNDPDIESRDDIERYLTNKFQKLTQDLPTDIGFIQGELELGYDKKHPLICSCGVTH